MNLKWVLRNIVLNGLLISILVTSLLIDAGHISLLSPDQTQEKGVETLQELEKNTCITNKELKQTLDLDYFQYLNLRTLLQEKRLMLHYECGFKTTLPGKLYFKAKNPQKIQELPEPQPVKARSGQPFQEEYYPNLTTD